MYNLYILIVVQIMMIQISPPPTLKCFLRAWLHDHLGFDCHVGPIFAGSFGYADDVALVSPTLYSMDKMIKVCEIFADKIGLLFNPLKSKLLCYNVDNPDTVYVTLGNTMVRASLHDKH